jgi:hypothetical protein
MAKTKGGMTTYRESQSRTQSNVFSVREVTRDITRHRDGTTKTFETETIKEQAFIQQEQIQREFQVAKQAYLTRKMEKWQSMIRSWHKPSGTRKKLMHERTKTVRHLGSNGDVPTLSANSFEQALSEQRAALRYGCATLNIDSEIFSDKNTQERFENLLHEYHEKYTPMSLDPDGTGSFYLASILMRLRKNCGRQKHMVKIVEDLKADEKRRADKNPVHTKQIAPGVLQRVSKPLFPFTQFDLQVTSELQQSERDVSSDDLEEFLFTCLKTNATDPELLSPALGHLISVSILLQYEDVPWPRLVSLGSMEERSLHSFGYTPSLFWGRSASGKEWFACCVFQVGNTLYENVWVEVPLLCISEEYGKTIESEFYKERLGVEKLYISRISDVPDLLAITSPEQEEFSKLRRMQNNLDNLLENKEELVQMSQTKRELGNTLSRLQIKSRRI